MKNIAFNIIATGDLDPQRVAISSMRGEITYGRLNRMLWNVAAHLYESGVRRDSCVAILTRNSLVGICGILSIAMLGAKWVQATPAIKGKQFLGVTHLLHSGEAREGSFEGITPIHLSPEWIISPESGVASVQSVIDEIQGNAEDTDVWMIAQSSGTTGVPKFMALSYENYWSRNNKAALTHDFEPVITGCLFPALSGPWVSYNLRTLRLRGTLVFGENLDLLARKNVQKVFGSPTQFDAFMRANRFSYAPKLPIAHVAGATISRGFSQRILERFDIIHNFYGGTEIGGISRNVITRVEDETKCVGKLLAGNELIITNENGEQLPVNTEGLIGVKNNIIATGYMENAEATTACFRDGWFFSGDLGYVDENGNLYVSGRSGDVLNISGVKVNAIDFERVLNSCPSVLGSACYIQQNQAGADGLSAIIHPVEEAPVDIIKKEIESALASTPVHAAKLRSFCLVDGLPLNDNGKIIRKNVPTAAVGRSQHIVRY